MIATEHPDSVDIARIKAALRHLDDGDTIDDVLEYIHAGVYILLRSANSTITIMLEPNGIHIYQMTGTMDDFDEILVCLDRIAEEQDKRYITLEGRKGWARSKHLKAIGCYPRGNRIVFDREAP